MEYFVQSGADGSFLDQVLNPAEVSQHLTGGDEAYRVMRQMQSLTDHHARIINGHREAGYTTGKDRGMKVIARFPQSVLIALLALEPNLLKDKQTFERILKKYPIYRAYSTGAAG